MLFFIANWIQSSANRKKREKTTSKARARATSTVTAIQWINTIDVETRAHCILAVFSMCVFSLSIFVFWISLHLYPLNTNSRHSIKNTAFYDSFNGMNKTTQKRSIWHGLFCYWFQLEGTWKKAMSKKRKQP